MKKRLPLLILGIAASVILSGPLLAQEQVEMSIKVTKNGKVVQDTTYKYNDALEAKHAIKMMGVLSGNHEDNHSKAMVFISEDGETTELKEFHGDSLVWVSEGEEYGDHVKVMKYKVSEGDHPHGKHVIVVDSDDGNTFDIQVDENCEEDHKNKDENVEVIVIKKYIDEDVDHDEEVEVEIVKKK